MADGNTEPQGNEPTEPTEPQGNEVDWQAKYEELKKESRKWEKRAEANKKVAEQAEKSAGERIAALEAKLEAADKAEAKRKLAAEVAQKKGVPADLLAGDTEEEMEAWADKLLAFNKKRPAAKVDNPGKFSTGGDGKDDAGLRDFTRKLLGND
ncbi:hypothetical protein [Olsenella urininfantis]|uniref:hypothetical protein n=1 Tax=Olsenella urininfantis TaxID=1871033 RepID=UPI000987AAC0|nr:hypothetical protein [Olsenella urininfantis]